MQLFNVRSDTWQMYILTDVIIFTEDTASHFPSPGDTCGMMLHVHAHGASCLHLSPDERKAHSVSSLTQSSPRLPTNVLDRFDVHDLQL
jgi:hypothetical protein